MNTSPLHELAQRQLADYDAHHPGRIFEQGASFLTVAQAYALQVEVARLRIQRGEPLAGYKVGCVSEAVRGQLDLQRPVFGHLFATEIYPSGAVLDSARFEGLAVEGEIAVRIGEDIPDSEWLRRRRDQAIATAFAVIELHNYVFRSNVRMAQELIANNALQAGVVLPAQERVMKEDTDLLDEGLSVFRNGELLATAASALPRGLFASLLQLVEHLRKFGLRLRRGQIVLTGSPLPLYRVFAGDRIAVRCARLAPVETAIT